MATLIAIDYGSKKLGIAIGQTVTGTSQPHSIIFQNGEMWQQIDKLFKEWRPSAVIIGEPKLADGKPHPLEKLIESFINTLETRYNAKIYRENEAYTSFEAGEYQLKKQTNHLVDAHAAAIFLESWMRTNPL